MVVHYATYSILEIQAAANSNGEINFVVVKTVGE
jgi:hypothetical protein